MPAGYKIILPKLMPSEYKVKTPQHILEINNKKRRVKALVGVWDSPQNCHVVRKPKIDFHTEHNLPFEIADWSPLPGFPPSQDFIRFRVGTCEGLWRSTEDSYDILAIDNNDKGNGHFNDTMQWFEHSCKRDKKVLRVLQVWNTRFKQHLINKRSFNDIGNDDLEKVWA